ncbi:MAG: class I SAM-dependent methyltransferase [bacterium]|nr:class I SAM-dependent methyltransferase [bacterium]
MPVSSCSLCASSELELVIDLGFHPLADTFIKKEELMQPEVRYPLQVLLCKSCGHAMSSYVVPATKRYQEHDYSYDSGNSKVSVEHFGEMAQEAIQKVGVGAGDLVVDIGGNVGTLLDAFRAQAGTHILNIEPAGNIADIAEKNGVETVRNFFGGEVAHTIAKRGGAKVIAMTNAFNHIAYLDDFMQGIVQALRPDGAFLIEVPYLLHLVEKLAFDTVYLEHVSYFALRPLRTYFKKFGLVISDVIENDYMGGSMRLYVRKSGPGFAGLADMVAREEAAQLFDPLMYRGFMQKVLAFKFSLLKELLEAKAEGGRIVGIGAATKGNTLLNYCGIDATLLEFVTDASVLKIGKYTPGSHLEIKPDEAITAGITHALILPWNIGDFLRGKLTPKYPSLVFITPHMGE